MHLLCLIFTHPKGWRWEELQYEQVWSLGCLWLPCHHCKLSLMITPGDLATISFSKSIDIFLESFTGERRVLPLSFHLAGFWLRRISRSFCWFLFLRSMGYSSNHSSFEKSGPKIVNWYVILDLISVDKFGEISHSSAKLLQVNSVSRTQIHQTIHRQNLFKPA